MNHLVLTSALITFGFLLAHNSTLAQQVFNSENGSKSVESLVLSWTI